MGLTRRFLFNDASWHGQCEAPEQFRDCIRFCLEVHAALRRYGSGLEVGYNFRQRPVGFVPTVQDALRTLPLEVRSRLLVWLDKNGPFWDRPAQHSAGEYFECQDEIVTETALAEAAHLVSDGESPVTISLPGSRYLGATLTVTWHDGPLGTKTISVTNATTPGAIEEFAKTSEPDFSNYEALIRWAQKECRHLAVVKKELLDQMGTTFIPAVAKRGRELFAGLNSISEALHQKDANRYNALCAEWLTGVRMSDSSHSEKTDEEFKHRMRFKHPCTGQSLWCFWHGKVSTGVFRLHFEWPPPFLGRRLFVAYFGPKLTKK